MKKPETKFKEKVRKDLETLENTWFVKIQQVSIRGIPDFLLCVNGGFVAIELKKDADSMRNKLQEWTLTSISHAGGMSFVAHPDNWTETFDVIKNMDYQSEDYDRSEDFESRH